MSQAHDECDKSDPQEDNKESDSVGNVTNDLSANTLNSATNGENLNSEVNEQSDTKNGRGTVAWTKEGDNFRVSWHLQADTATPKDYVALCYKGKLIFFLKPVLEY